MNKVPFKNYVFLLLIIVFTVFITLFVSTLYKDSKRIVTDFYSYSNKITNKDFELYITENPNTIIYIYDKYNNSRKEFEENLKNQLETKYLTNNFVYMDKRELNKNLINYIKNNYGVQLKYNGKPVILIITDDEATSMIEVDEEANVDSLNLEVFE